jgi:flagellar biosynthesis/type III secretory pathway protein FliH
MSYHLYGSPATLAIGKQGAIVKSADREEFSTALDLRKALLQMQQDATERAAILQSEAQARGFAEGRGAVDAHISQAIADLNGRITEFEAQVQDQIASAALAATRAIIGQIPSDQVLTGIVQEAVGRLEQQNENVLQIEVAPAMLTQVMTHLNAQTGAKLVANPALSDQDCVVVTAAGRLVASLDVQLDSLAKRWGIGTVSSPDAAYSMEKTADVDAG